MTSVLLALLLSQASPLVLTGEVSATGPDFVRVPFDVPAGLAELEVSHTVEGADNILDFGVESPLGFRGYGGGNTESAVIGVQASSRSYLTGELTPGTWAVYLGKAKVEGAPAKYRLEVTYRAAATLPPQPQRTPYVPAAALSSEARWYAGDFHVHSSESGDAKATMDEVAAFAKSRGLDFIELSEHNTRSQLDYYADVQARHPGLLLIPGVEFTTFNGHANGIGATEWVDHRLGLDGATMETAAAALVGQGAALSINHPVLDLGNNCIGCAWKHPIPREHLSAVEIQTGGYDKTGVLFSKQALAFWDRLLNQGLHVAPIGGSDDHRGGMGTDAFSSPIGNPTTMVFARGLSAEAIVEAVKAGRTVVKLQGPNDPMVELHLGEAGIGDTVKAGAPEVRARVTGGAGAQLKWVVDGVAREDVIAVEGDDFEATLVMEPPTSGEVRVRAEVWVANAPRTVTGHLWLAVPDAPKGCGCSTGQGGALLSLLLLAARRRRG
jgi:PHP domain